MWNNPFVSTPDKVQLNRIDGMGEDGPMVLTTTSNTRLVLRGTKCRRIDVYLGTEQMFDASQTFWCIPKIIKDAHSGIHEWVPIYTHISNS